MVKDGKELANGTPLDARYAPLIDAFGILQASAACTATHIGDGWVLSAGHCFLASSAGKKDVACTGSTVARPDLELRARRRRQRCG